jgi:tRNA-specific 2-thiouridylase
MPLKAGAQSVTVALSGGKDSTAAILLLLEQGFAVQALTMRLGLADEDGKLERIERLTRLLGVPWRVDDLGAAFRADVLDRFVAAYRHGLTPNPCVLCNRRIKFGLLLAGMMKKSPEGFFASGHYAGKEFRDGRWFLREPADRRKSQIYFLAMIDPAVLDSVLFPLSGLTVSQVRAKVAGLPLVSNRESQDVCFLQGEPLAAFLARHCPDAFQEGDFVDEQGRVIGRHRGAVHFTRGQRRGTGLASDRRRYVLRCDLAANTVTLGEESALYSGTVTVGDPVFWRPLRRGESLSVKVRYQIHGHEATIDEIDARSVRAIFREPVRAVTPGQLAVFYDGDTIVAAGEICRA